MQCSSNAKKHKCARDQGADDLPVLEAALVGQVEALLHDAALGCTWVRHADNLHIHKEALWLSLSERSATSSRGCGTFSRWGAISAMREYAVPRWPAPMTTART